MFLTCRFVFRWLALCDVFIFGTIFLAWIVLCRTTCYLYKFVSRKGRLRETFSVTFTVTATRVLRRCCAVNLLFVPSFVTLQHIFVQFLHVSYFNCYINSCYLQIHPFLIILSMCPNNLQLSLPKYCTWSIFKLFFNTSGRELQRNIICFVVFIDQTELTRKCFTKWLKWGKISRKEIDVELKKELDESIVHFEMYITRRFSCSRSDINGVEDV